jgi:hypothetical protein
MRAANYLLITERIVAWADSRRMNVYGLALQAFKRGLTLSGNKVDRIEVKYQGATLSGWLRLPDNAAGAPAIVFFTGFDSLKEMHYLMFADIAANREIATLFVDQEGTREAIRYHRFPKRYDTEVSASDGSVSDGLPESGFHAMWVTGTTSITDAIVDRFGTRLPPSKPDPGFRGLREFTAVICRLPVNGILRMRGRISMNLKNGMRPLATELARGPTCSTLSAFAPA